jgi:hypothetical protein
MDDILQYLAAHPLAIMALLFAVFLFVYFLFKQFIKMVLGVVIILLALGGYFYFKDPDHVWQNMKATLQKAWTQTGKAVETGKGAYQEGKTLYEKGKKLPGDIKKALDKSRETTEEK